MYHSEYKYQPDTVAVIAEGAMHPDHMHDTHGLQPFRRRYPSTFEFHRMPFFPLVSLTGGNRRFRNNTRTTIREQQLAMIFTARALFSFPYRSCSYSTIFQIRILWPRVQKDREYYVTVERVLDRNRHILETVAFPLHGNFSGRAYSVSLSILDYRSVNTSATAPNSRDGVYSRHEYAAVFYASTIPEIESALSLSSVSTVGFPNHQASTTEKG